MQSRGRHPIKLSPCVLLTALAVSLALIAVNQAELRWRSFAQFTKKKRTPTSAPKPPVAIPGKKKGKDPPSASAPTSFSIPRVTWPEFVTVTLNRYGGLVARQIKRANYFTVEIGNGGVAGIGFWDTATCGRDAAAIAKAIRHAAGVMGVDHVALGSDYDGAITAPFDTTGVVQITDALLKEGFREDEIRKTCWRNSPSSFKSTPSSGRRKSNSNPRASSSSLSKWRSRCAISLNRS